MRLVIGKTYNIRLMMNDPELTAAGQRYINDELTRRRMDDSKPTVVKGILDSVDGEDQVIYFTFKLKDCAIEEIAMRNDELAIVLSNKGLLSFRRRALS